ncbi:MAG: mercury resistance system transport protein MerF [Magnetovibrio sp.]|nr:mercury resistance system transport protein MerF [Magnetovibrio sp.]
MEDRTVLKTGLIGSGVLAVCCFTPFLVIVLGGVGLSAWLGWLDYVLLPALAIFMGVAVYGLSLWRKKKYG